MAGELALSAIPAGEVPSYAARMAARRLLAMSCAALGGIALIGGFAAFMLHGLTGFDADPLVVLATGLGLGAVSMIGLATTVRFRLLDAGFIVVLAAWMAACAYLSGSHQILSAAVGMTLAAALLAVRKHPPMDNTAGIDEMQDYASVDVAAHPHDGPILDSAGQVVSDFHFADIRLHAHETFIDRVHLNDRVAYLNALADARSTAPGEAACRVRFNINDRGHRPEYAVKSFHLKKSADGAIEIGFQQTIVSEPGSGQASDQATRRMLALVSHELRTPLNAIIGFSDVLKTGMFGELTDPRQRDYLDVINGAGKDLLQLVNMLLDVSKLEAGAYQIFLEPFNLNRVVGDCTRLLSGQAEAKKIHLVARLVEDQGETVADCRAVRQVLVNLMSNAIKFTPEGGCITVETGPLADGHGFKIVVTDTGIGMTPEQVEMACEAYRQADNNFTRSGQGTGLGLALTKGLVDLHGGELVIESDPEIGTAVTATFPAPTAATVSLKTDELFSPRRREIGTEDGNQKKGKAA